MQVATRAVDGDFQAENTAQGVGERGFVARSHCRVGDRDKIAGQFFTVFLEKIREMRTADLLFPLDEEGHIHR